ncbi:ABC transporter permease, partial [Candidatus Dependentiae bacterium]
PIMAIAALESCATFDFFSSTSRLLADYDGEKTVSYPLTLPLPSWLVFVKFALSRALFLGCLLSIIMPLEKLILGGVLDFSHFSTLKFMFAYVTLCICAGIFGVWASSIPKNIGHLGTVWHRYLFPLWWFGGSIFPYYSVAKAFPWLSKLLLINPFIYANESLRFAVLGTQTPTLPFWPCVGALWVVIVVLGLWGTLRLRRKLDFV